MPHRHRHVAPPHRRAPFRSLNGEPPNGARPPFRGRYLIFDYLIVVGARACPRPFSRSRNLGRGQARAPTGNVFFQIPTPESARPLPTGLVPHRRGWSQWVGPCPYEPYNLAATKAARGTLVICVARSSHGLPASVRVASILYSFPLLLLPMSVVQYWVHLPVYW